MSYDEEDKESGTVTPKMNKFTHEICDWLMLTSIVFVVIYGILYIFYEVALGMAHIRWVYNTFLLICIIDIVAYFITRFAVTGEVNHCLLYLSVIIFVGTLLINIAAPAKVLISYELTLEHPSSGTGSVIETKAHTGDQEPQEFIYGEELPQDCGVDSSGFKCGVVKSIRTSVWCMFILLIPRPLVIYSILTVLKRRRMTNTGGTFVSA